VSDAEGKRRRKWRSADEEEKEKEEDDGGHTGYPAIAHRVIRHPSQNGCHIVPCSPSILGDCEGQCPCRIGLVEGHDGKGDEVGVVANGKQGKVRWRTTEGIRVRGGGRGVEGHCEVGMWVTKRRAKY